MSRCCKRKTIDGVDEDETLVITDEAQFGSGSAADPSITFINDNDSGYYLKSDGVIGVAIGGTEVASFDSGGLISAVSYEVADGTAAAPSITFTSDPDTGIYRDATNTIAVSTGGTKRRAVSTADETFTLPQLGGAGSATAPTYSFSGDPNTGIYGGSGDILRFAAGGASQFTISTSGVTSTPAVTVPAGTAAAPALNFSGDTDTGLYSAAANTLGISTGGTVKRSVSATEEIFTLPQQGAIGGVSAPTYSFSTATTSGIYSSGSGNVDVAVGGVNALNIEASRANFAGVLQVANGTAADPSISFNTDTDVGLYSIANDQLGVSVGGTLRKTITPTEETNTLPLQGPAGSASAPTYSFTGSSNTGMWYPGANTINFSANSSDKVQISPAYLRVLGTSMVFANQLGGAGAPSFSFVTDTDTGMYGTGSNALGFATAGSNRLTIADAAISPTVPINAADGSASAPAYSFTSDPNTGFYSTSADNISIATGGSQRVTVSSLSMSMIGTQVLKIADGSASAPGLQFVSDTNTGIYSVGADNIGISTGGTKRLDISSTAITSTVPIVVSSVSSGFTTTVSSATPITLTASSNGVQEITGSTNQTVILPSALTLTIGHTFKFLVAASAGITVTFQDNGLNTLLTGENSGTSQFTAVLTAQADANGTWDFYDIGSATPGNNETVMTGSNGATHLLLGSTTTPTYSFHLDSNTGMYSSAADTIDFTTGGTTRLTTSTTAVTSTLPIVHPSGAAATPSITFTGDLDTGFFNTADAILASTGGSQRLSIGSSQITAAVPVAVPAGTSSQTSPSFTFNGDGNTGMYWVSSDTLGLTTGGTSRLTLSTSALTSTLPYVAPLGAVGTPSLTFTGGTTTGIYAPSIASVAIAIGGVQTLTAQAGAVISTGVIVAPTQAATAPGFTFSGVTDRGLYSTATGNVGLAVGGTSILESTATAVTTTVPVVVPLGAVGAPSITFAGDTNTGIYSPGADQVAISTGGSQRWFTSTTGSEFSVPVGIAAGSVTSPSLYLIGDADGTGTGLYRVAANDLGVTTNGTLRLDVSTTAVTSTLPVIGPVGVAATPTYSFTGDTNTGVYWIASDNIGVSTGGTLRLDVSTSAVTSTLPVIHPLGSVGAPSITFAGDTNTGIYGSGTGEIQFSCDGSNELTVAAARVSAGAPINLASYTVAGVPSGASGDLILVTNDAGSPNVIPAYHDGSAWRRVDTAAILS